MKQLNQAYLNNSNAAMVVLQYLNIRDVTAMIPKLKQFKFMDTLSFHGNNLNYIPCLQTLDQLKQLDLSQNPIKIDNRLMDSLFSIPNLQSLIIDFKSQDDKQMILQNLPKLNYLNGIRIQRKKQERPPKQEQMKIIKEKLAAQQQHIKTLLQNIYTMLDENNKPPDSTQQLSFSLKYVVEQFQYFYQNINSELARQCVYLYYKNKLYQVVDTHVSTFLEDHDHQNIATALDELNKSKKQGFQEILKIVLSHAYQEDFSKQSVQPGNKLRKQTLYQNQITRLKKQVSDLMKQNQQLHQANQKYLQKIYHDKVNGVSKQKNHADALKVSRISNNTSNIPTSTHNHPQTPMNKLTPKKQFLKTPSKSAIKQQFSRSPSKNTLGSIINKKQNYQLQYQQLDKVATYQVVPKPKESDQNYHQFEKANSLGSLSVNKLKPNFSTRNIHKAQNEQDIKRSSSKQSLNYQKKLTLDQMIQFIDEFIYEKGKFNIQCANKGDLFQTPQQFLYTYFLRKYGLKDMALEWSLLIIKAIEKYNKQNIILQVFGKILKNTIEEQFYSKCIKFKQCLNPLLPLKDNFNSSDVRSIFFDVFTNDENESFQKFISKISCQNMRGQKYYERRDLMFALQGYFLRNHQRQISKYLDHFKMNDKDDDGILQSQQIEKCIGSFIKKYADHLNIYQSEQNLAALYEQILTKRRKKGNMVSMTFSQFIAIMRYYF